MEGDTEGEGQGVESLSGIVQTKLLLHKGYPKNSKPYPARKTSVKIESYPLQRKFVSESAIIRLKLILITGNYQ